jgi:DNA-binding NtrC family response regulator
LAAALSTIVIELPPLAGRRGDILLLAQALVEENNAQGGKQVGGLSAEALDRLDAYAWPGNLDELARAMAEAHQRAGGPEIAVADLPERLHLAASAAAHPRRKEETIVLDEFLGRMERELIRRALARAKGNKAKAARLLGLTRPRLYRRMVQLGLAGE